MLGRKGADVNFTEMKGKQFNNGREQKPANDSMCIDNERCCCRVTTA